MTKTRQAFSEQVKFVLLTFRLSQVEPELQQINEMGAKRNECPK